MDFSFSDEQRAAAETLTAEGIAPEYAAELAMQFAANVPAALAHYREAKARGNATPGLLAYAVRYGLQPSQPQTAPANHQGGAYERPALEPEKPQSDAERAGAVRAIRTGERIAELWPHLDETTRARLLRARYLPDADWRRELAALVPALKAAGKAAKAERAAAPGAASGEPRPAGYFFRALGIAVGNTGGDMAKT